MPGGDIDLPFKLIDAIAGFKLNCNNKLIDIIAGFD